MAQVIKLANRAQVMNYHLATVEINGRTLEMGLESGTHRPMVIDWERKLAWAGSWEELLEDIADILNEEEPADAATQ